MISRMSISTIDTRLLWCCWRYFEGTYFACIMLMCSLSVVFTVLVLNYHHRSPDTYDMPWLVNVHKTSIILRFCCWFLKIPGAGLHSPKIVSFQVGRAGWLRPKIFNHFGSTWNRMVRIPSTQDKFGTWVLAYLLFYYFVCLFVYFLYLFITFWLKYFNANNCNKSSCMFKIF